MEEKTLDTVLHNMAREAKEWIIETSLEDWIADIIENSNEPLEKKRTEAIGTKIKFIIADVLETLDCNIYDERDRIVDALDAERVFTTEDIVDLSVTLSELLRYATKEDKRIVSAILKEVLP